MTTSAASSKKRASQHGGNTGRRKILALIGVATILLGLILMPISKVSETEKVSDSETQTVAQSLCPPPIVTSLDSGNCQITIIEHLPNLTTNARTIVYDENGSIAYQSSLFEEAPDLVKRNYNFTVVNSGIYNITLEDAGIFFIKVEITAITWKNIAIHPFESFFYYGFTIAVMGWCVICLSFATERDGR